MGYSHTTTYYYSIHETITSLCKSLLPFRQRRLVARHHKQQSENLKWQQDSFHRILHLIALHREGIVPQSDVSTFRTHLLDTLIASPADAESPGLLRDKLLFLQELLYANCISQAEYHSSKRPLIQRLAVQGVEIDSRDLVICGKGEIDRAEAEEWSEIDLQDKEITPPPQKLKHRSPLRPLRNAMAMFSNKQRTDQIQSTVDPPRDSTTVLMAESIVEPPVKDGRSNKKKKKQWGFEGLRKWKRGGDVSSDEFAEMQLVSGERSEDAVECELVASPVGEGPDTKRIKTKIHSDGNASDFFIDKVLGDNIKKELTRIQTELGSTNKSLAFSEEQMNAVSTKLPVDKGDLKEFFPKSWCDRYGDMVLDVVKKEFKDHIAGMEDCRIAEREKRQSVSQKWVSFDDDGDENHHPNLFSGQPSSCIGNNPFADAPNNPFATRNPFFDDRHSSPLSAYSRC